MFNSAFLYPDIQFLLGSFFIRWYSLGLNFILVSKISFAKNFTLNLYLNFYTISKIVHLWPYWQVFLKIFQSVVVLFLSHQMADKRFLVTRKKNTCTKPLLVTCLQKNPECKVVLISLTPFSMICNRSKRVLLQKKVSTNQQYYYLNFFLCSKIIRSSRNWI